MEKDFKQEILQFINENNLNDIFINENGFYESYGSNLYVYFRVSTENQDFGRQILEIYEFAKKKSITICIDNIFCDKYTGKKLNRKAYQEVRKLLKENDYLLTTNLNRIGRDYEGIKKEWYFFKYQGIKILITDREVNEFISSPLPNESEDVTLNRLYLQDMIFTNTIYRDCLKILEVKETTKKGLEKAKMNGKKIGKPRSEKNSDKKLLLILEKMANGEMGQDRASICFDFPRMSLKRAIKRLYEKYNSKDYKILYENFKKELEQQESEVEE